jgi:PhnB protein
MKIGDTYMARVSTYLNFPRCTEEAFLFYQSVFGGEFTGGINRFSQVPGIENLSDADKNLVMHIELPLLGDHVLMGTDASESMGFKVMMGTNMHLNIEPDTRAETEKYFKALSQGGTITAPLQEMFWGAYYGSCTDKFGVQWMVNCNSKV